MNITNLKIAQRLGLGFGLVLTLLVLLAGLAVNSLRLAAQEEANLVEMEGRARLADEWVASTQLNITRVMALAKSGNNPAVEAYFKPLIAQTTERINTLQKELDAVISTEQGKAMLADIGARRKTYVDTRKTYFAALSGGDAAQADGLLQNSLMPAALAYVDAMKQFQTYEHGLVQERVLEAAHSIQRQQVVMLSLAALAMLVGVVVAWRVTRSIVDPLRQAVQAAGQVAQGDLTQTLSTRRRDELGDLLGALEGMRSALSRTVTEVRQSADGINVASAEIASGNQDLSARTEQAASNLEETAASMEELTSTVRNSADSARQANQLAASASEVAVRGGQVVSQVVATMQDIHHSSQKINDIIGTIDGIAFQTNILALNAAVEAARAGEQGRGFAVVAAEVRNLAQRSAEAAKEIKGLIGASVDKVETGTRLVADAGATMSEIVGSIQRVSDIVGEITAAAGEQSDGIGQVNTAVNQLDQMTQQNAALVEESAAAAQSLKDQAARLSQVVAVFRTGGATAGSLAALSTPMAPKAAHPAATPLYTPTPVQVRVSPKAQKPPAATARREPVLAAPSPKALAAHAPSSTQTTLGKTPAAAGPAPTPVAIKTAVPASAESDWESF